jgi:hypothetical protein
MPLHAFFLSLNVVLQYVNLEHILMLAAKIAQCVGADVTKSAVEDVCVRYLKPDAKRILDTLKIGGNPSGIALSRGPGQTGTGLGRFDFAAQFPCALRFLSTASSN